MVHRFDIEKLRKDIATKVRSLRITSHAQVEAFKDGLILADLRFIFEKGEVIELYPDENRGLLYAYLDEYAIPAHIVVEDTPTAGVVITAYVPDKQKWSGYRHRRSR